MARYLVRRLASTLFAIWAVATLVFLIVRVTGDPAVLLLSEQYTAEDLVRVRARLGLDRPLTVQYLRFLAGVPTIDFGRSYRFDQPARELVTERLPATLMLAVAAFGLAVVLSVPAGALSAARRNSTVDYAASFLSFLGFAMPIFWLGTMLIIVFGVFLRWLPTSGSGSWRHLVLPAVTLATFPLGQFTRLVRSEMLDALAADYVRTAHAKGLGEGAVLFRHALKNAALPVITLMGLTFGTLLGGAIITETIFAWPGLGRLVIQATIARDYPVVQTVVILLAIVFAAINLLVDLAYAALDPRIRLA
ncbi:MAG: ABC transporter permease [Armatimonadetes bacterium]|nr:ABC transporter permease [Armatimonadota bacterium]